MKRGEEGKKDGLSSYGACTPSHFLCLVKKKRVHLSTRFIAHRKAEMMKERERRHRRSLHGHRVSEGETTPTAYGAIKLSHETHAWKRSYTAVASRPPQASSNFSPPGW